MKISLCTPSRGRPAQIERLWISALDTATNPDNLELALRLDYDDKESQDKVKTLSRSNQVKVALGTRWKLFGTQIWNDAYSAATKHGDLFMLSADDLIFETPNWDNIIINTFNQWPDKIGYVSPTDRRGNTWPTHGWIHQNWIDAVGYFVPVMYFYGDDVWLGMVSKKVGRFIWQKDVIVYHKHLGFQHLWIDTAYDIPKEEENRVTSFETWKYRNSDKQRSIQQWNGFKRSSVGPIHDSKLLEKYIKDFKRRQENDDSRSSQ